VKLATFQIATAIADLGNNGEGGKKSFRFVPSCLTVVQAGSRLSITAGGGGGLIPDPFHGRRRPNCVLYIPVPINIKMYQTYLNTWESVH
jgi:hypothetical protein